VFCLLRRLHFRLCNLTSLTVTTKTGTWLCIKGSNGDQSANGEDNFITHYTQTVQVCQLLRTNQINPPRQSCTSSLTQISRDRSKSHTSTRQSKLVRVVTRSGTKAMVEITRLPVNIQNITLRSTTLRKTILH
jgi:hypothetical protein